MGFKVDTAEIKTAIDNYQKTATAANEQLVSAKTSMNGIITSNAMQGQVGQAIAADINNNQNAVIVGLADSYTAVAMEMTQLYQSFKSTTGETSDSAVINQEALDKAKTSIDSLKTAHKSVETTIHNIYFGVADLISLTLPKSEFNETADEVKKYVDKIIEKVTTFDSQQGKSTNEDMLAKLKTQIQSAEKVGSLSYTDPQFLVFASSTGLAEDVQDYHTSVSEEAEKLRKEKEKDLNSMTPSEMVAKYGANDPDVKKRINDINNGISWTSIGTGLISSTAMLGKEALSSKISDEVAKKIASGIVDTVKNNTTTFMDKGLVAVTSVGTNVTFSAPPTMLTNIIRNGAKYAVPGVGALIDFGMQKASGENTGDALIKTGGHIGAGVLGAEIGTLIGGPLGTAVGFGVGVVGSMVFDAIYDNKDKIVNKFGEVSNDVGEALADAWGNVTSAFG